MIGIVCPYKNAPKYTIDFIKSIKTKHEFVLILIDDFSSLDTKDTIKKFLMSIDLDVDLIENYPTISLAEKWNIGCRKAFDEYGCDYVIVANNDVLLHPKTIDNMIDRLSVGDVAMVTACNIRGFLSVPEQIFDYELPEEISERPHPDFSFFSMNRDCWESVGEFDVRFAPAFWEDNDYHTRIIHADRMAININQAPYYHYGSVTADVEKDAWQHHSFDLNRILFRHKYAMEPEEAKKRKPEPRKKRVVALGDFTCETGMGRFMHETMTRLKASGQFDISVVGINYMGLPHPLMREFDVYPAILHDDVFGSGTLKDVIGFVDPDITFLFQDHWNLYRLVSDAENTRGLILYYPLDAKNIMPNYVYKLSEAAAIACPTEFAISETMKSAQFLYDDTVKKLRGSGQIEVTHLDVNIGGRDIDFDLGALRQLTKREYYSKIYHGVNTQDFFPMDKMSCRGELGLPKKKFIVGFVGRNQIRKNPHVVMEAVAAMNNKDVCLVMHTELATEYNLPQLRDYYGLQTQVIFSHQLFDIGDDNKENLRMLYNCFDVMVNPAGGEGWGFTTMEGAACGIAQVVCDYAAGGEIWKDSAIMLRNGTYRPNSHINTMLFTPNANELAYELLALYEDRTLLYKWGAKAYDKAMEPHFNWDNIAEKMITLFNNYSYYPKQSVPVCVNYDFQPTLTKFRKKENEQTKT